VDRAGRRNLGQPSKYPGENAQRGHKGNRVTKRPKSELQYSTDSALLSMGAVCILVRHISNC